jgi:hypothetical protein
VGADHRRLRRRGHRQGEEGENGEQGGENRTGHAADSGASPRPAHRGLP